jgi:hypothetical protein
LREEEMNELPEDKVPRGKIGMRLLLTILYLVILHVVQFVVQVLCLVQYIILFITRTHSEPLRKFSNQAASYAYRLIRYATLNENARPFPFTEFPKEIEYPEDTIKFD